MEKSDKLKAAETECLFLEFGGFFEINLFGECRRCAYVTNQAGFNLVEELLPNSPAVFKTVGTLSPTIVDWLLNTEDGEFYYLADKIGYYPTFKLTRIKGAATEAFAMVRYDSIHHRDER
jgi:hypothetical protein